MTCTVDELAESLGVIDRHRRHFEHVISMFVREGILQRTGERVEIVREADPMPELDRRRHALDGEYPEAAVYTPLLALCFDHYPKILSGRTTSVEVLFPGVSDPPMSCLYANNQMADLCNDLVAWWTLRYVTDNVPADRSIGIVELGAGTGSTTLPVLHALTSWKERIDYAYTDLSLAFRTWGAKKFQKDFPCVRFARLDISAPPAAQGFSEGAADVVIAANIIHTTPDIRASVRHVYSMLRPGGVLILNELTGCPDIYAIVTGLLDGWWLCQDPELRIPESPLLDLMHWKSVLSEVRRSERITAGNETMVLNMCLNYGGRAEIVDAAREVARLAKAGKLDPDRLSEDRFRRFLDEPEIPDVDLFLRSSGEQRTSNFLLWQSAYAEFIFLDRLWPDFDRRDLWDAIEQYATRERRFGTA